MKKNFLTLLAAVLLVPTLSSQAQHLYTNDFQSVEVGKIPEDLLVLDGQFTVQEEATNRFLELPGAPTDTYTVMFGPSTNLNLGVSARVFATAKGRRMPAFAVALNGVGGYKLQVSPAKKSIELFKGDEVLKTAEYSWESGQWTSLALSAAGTNPVQLKATVTQDNKKAVVMSHTDTNAINPGKASIVGTPFSGLPIRFDDLAVYSVK